MKTTAKGNDKSVRVRFADELLLKKVDEAAANEGRSRNTEILMRLSASFHQGRRHRTASR
jgi:hypothetical protein